MPSGIHTGPFSLPTKGFILTRHKKEKRGLVFLEYWLATDDGPVKLVTDPQREVYFVRQADVERVGELLAERCSSCEIKSLALKTIDQQPVAAIYFSSSSAAYQARDLLQQADITCYEDDIRLTDRFLMERFVYGNLCFSGIAGLDAHQDRFKVFQKVQVKPTGYSPNFSIISLDIECSEHGELYSIGLMGEAYRQVLMIGTADSEAPRWIEWVTNEKALLQRFVQVVQQLDPDIFIGWNVVNFDFRLLIQRAALHRVPLAIGRDHHVIRWRDGRESQQGFVVMEGRVIIDGIDALKTATYHFDSFSLESVAQQLLGKGKKSDDVEHRMAAITHDFIHNKVRLAEYNLQDCALVLEIFQHTRLLNFLTLRSQLTGLALDRQGGSVAAFINLYLPKFHRAGYVSPNRPDNGGLASPGGYVMDSVPGLYRNVLVLDFKSLYPSIIRTFNIDPLGLIEGLLSPQNAIAGFKGALFSREKHFLPDIIRRLWEQRDEAKQQKDRARSQALKILMNSFYGVLGSGGCPFYDTRLASSITLRGHEIMQTTTGWIQAENYHVIYGDTDSLFIALDHRCSTDEAESIGRALQESINRRWQQKIRSDYQLESRLELEFETHYSQFLMPTIRGSEKGSKKRYAGIKEGVLVFKGLENVRSDWTPLAKQFQYELYQRVFAGEDVKAFIRAQIAAIRSGSVDEQLIYRKRLRRPLAMYVKNIPPHVKAARLADQQNQRLGKPLRYQNKGWIRYWMTVAGPESMEYQSHPLDYDHYIEKQIRPVAEGILPFIDLSFEEIYRRQMALF